MRRKERISCAAQHDEQRKPSQKRDAPRDFLKVVVDVAAVDDEDGGDKPHRNGVHVEPQKVGELVNVGLHALKIKKKRERECAFADVTRYHLNLSFSVKHSGRIAL